MLMVEDEAAILKAGKRILEGLGYTVLTAARRSVKCVKDGHRLRFPVKAGKAIIVRPVALPQHARDRSRR